MQVLEDMVALGLVVTIVVVEWSFMIWKFGSPRSRMRSHVLKLIQVPGSAYTVKVGNANGTWNPANKRVTRYDTGLIYGKGRGTYWRDETGTVHLLFQPVGGPEQHLAAVVAELPRRRRRTLAVWGVLGAYPLMAVVGFVIAYATASGSTQSPTDVGFFGAALGFICVYVVGHGFFVGRAILTSARRTGSHGGAPESAFDVVATPRSPMPNTATPVPAGPVPDWVTSKLRHEVAGRRSWQIPRAWPLALLGLLGVLVATFVFDPLSNSDHVSVQFGDALALAANVSGFGGVLLLLASAVCFVLRMGQRPHDGR